jgi:alanine transaminase
MINPGNPTGSIFPEESLRDTVKFCYDHHLIIMSDEVYQNNIYTPKKKFHSMRKVASNMQKPYNDTAIISFNSTSKGYYGE